MIKNISGIKRVLTSGGKPTAKEGIPLLKEIITTAGAYLVIIVAGKVTEQNIDDIGKLSHANEFHGKNIVGNL